MRPPNFYKLRRRKPSLQSSAPLSGWFLTDFLCSPSGENVHRAELDDSSAQCICQAEKQAWVFYLNKVSINPRSTSPIFIPQNKQKNELSLLMRDVGKAVATAIARKDRSLQVAMFLCQV